MCVCEHFHNCHAEGDHSGRCVHFDCAHYVRKVVPGPEEPA